MKISKRYRGKTRIEMIPLMDVIFLLLVAFIFFTMSMTVHRGIPIELPSSSTAKVEKKDFVEISIKKDGSVFFNKREVAMEELLLEVTSLSRVSPDRKIIISGDGGASYETIVSVLDVIRKSGVTKVSLDTKWK
ncbi:MAG: biopolymer transporter ExbD [Deltaproteobacteria bacterium]|nr:biopolymer transporter ExbD [Deltaproteobacteria bacterium]MBN2844668.1 biopolymer transporter ExbD [Deltaproteobacteria bacterium]